jgi:ABC-type branched-subunit amino acid transport system ATPase component
MVAMARALALRPKILLADELSFGLAPLVVNRLFGALVTAAGDGTGILLVEQQVTHVLQMAHRACVLRNGRMVISGTSAEVKADADQLQAAYLGGRADHGRPDSPGGSDDHR